MGVNDFKEDSFEVSTMHASLLSTMIDVKAHSGIMSRSPLLYDKPAPGSTINNISSKNAAFACAGL